MTRAEEAALTAYPDRGVDAYSRGRKKTYRQKYIEGYEQAEKDTIERACKWVKLHSCTFNNMEEVDLYVDLFRKAMEEE